MKLISILLFCHVTTFGSELVVSNLSADKIQFDESKGEYYIQYSTEGKQAGTKMADVLWVKVVNEQDVKKASDSYYAGYDAQFKQPLEQSKWTEVNGVMVSGVSIRGKEAQKNLVKQISSDKQYFIHAELVGWSPELVEKKIALMSKLSVSEK